MTRSLKQTIGPLLSLIILLAFATSKTAIGSEEETVEKESVEEKNIDSLPEPRYDLADDARDPFQSAAAHKKRTEQASGKDRALTLQDAVKDLQFRGLTIKSPDSGLAIINDKLYEPGDSLTVETKEGEIELTLARFDPSRSALVFTGKDGEEASVVMEDE